MNNTHLPIFIISQTKNKYFGHNKVYVYEALALKVDQSTPISHNKNTFFCYIFLICLATPYFFVVILWNNKCPSWISKNSLAFYSITMKKIKYCENLYHYD